MHRVKTFSCRLSEAGVCYLLYFLVALLKPVGTHEQQGIPRVCLTLVAKGAGILELQSTIIIGRTILGRSNNQDTTQRLKHTPNLPVKKAYLLILELQLAKEVPGSIGYAVFPENVSRKTPFLGTSLSC